MKNSKNRLWNNRLFKMFSCLHCLPDNHSNVWEKDGEENTDDDGGRVDSHHVPQSWDSWNELKKVFFVKWFIWKSHRARLFCRSDKAQRPWKLMKGWNSYSDNIKKLHYEWKVVQQIKMLSKTDEPKEGESAKKETYLRMYMMRGKTVSIWKKRKILAATVSTSCLWKLFSKFWSWSWC